MTHEQHAKIIAPERPCELSDVYWLHGLCQNCGYGAVYAYSAAAPFTLPARVRFNENVASAFVGKTGTITKGPRYSAIGQHLIWTVELDEPIASAANWTPLKTLAAGLKHFDLLRLL